MAGYQLMIVDEIFAALSQRFEKPTAIVANSVNEYVIDLHSGNHCFRKGHRVMVQVQAPGSRFTTQPAKVRGEYFTAPTFRLSDCDPARVRVGSVSVARDLAVIK